MWILEVNASLIWTSLDDCSDLHFLLQVERWMERLEEAEVKRRISIKAVAIFLSLAVSQLSQGLPLNLEFPLSDSRTSDF